LQARASNKLDKDNEQKYLSNIKAAEKEVQELTDKVSETYYLTNQSPCAEISPRSESQ